MIALAILAAALDYCISADVAHAAEAAKLTVWCVSMTFASIGLGVTFGGVDVGRALCHD